MPNKNPINLALQKEKGLLDEKRFYSLLSQKCNYMDDENVRMFYLGLVKVITRELRENQFVRLPHLGDVAIVSYRPARKLNGKTKDGRYIRSVLAYNNILRFVPNVTFRKYYKAQVKLQQDVGMIDG